MSTQDDPQACTKCGCMPEDILMLACNHDLCLNCAADRLAFEMRKNKNTNVIVCQECHEKTPLDAESITVLKGLIKPTASQARSYEPVTAPMPSKYQENQNKFQRTSRNAPVQKIADKYSYDKGNSVALDRGYQKPTYDKVSNGTKSRVATTDIFQGVSSKKTCTEHHDEEILYFCFDCRCECICPECVIHGKHKDHDVKTIRKSQPLVKAEVDKYLQSFDRNIQTLLIKKSDIQKQIRGLNQQNNMSKRQIQQTFDELRAKINQQQKQIISRFDQNLNQNLGQLDRSAKLILKTIDQLKTYTTTMNEASRKDQILFLNFYSKKYKQLEQEAKQPQVSVPYVQVPSNQNILSAILDLADQVSRISFGNGPKGQR